MADYNYTWKQFIMGAFSENGEPSSSRIITFMLAFGSLLIVSWLFHHIMWLATDKLTLWLATLPTLIMALVGMFMAPYGINRGSSTVSEAANAFFQRPKKVDLKPEPKPEPEPAPEAPQQ